MLKKILWSLENIIMKRKILKISRMTKRYYDDTIYYNRKKYVVDHYYNRIRRIQ